MSRLSLKVFLWFWATAMITAAAVVIAFHLWSGGNHAWGEHARSAAFSRPDAWFIARQWIVAVGVSGLICLVLTRYLVAPILSLRAISRELAEGHLKVRVSETLERRRDEIGGLVRDFNAMAFRIEELVRQQRQLMFDMSHELRSPLARLTVALDLKREQNGSDPILDQMEQDLNLMNEMITRLLTIAKLDVYTEPLSAEPVNIPDLVAEVVQNATFEAQRRGVTLQSYESDPKLCVLGDAAFLYSAIENVVRNAVKFTDPGTQVTVHVTADEGTHVRIRVSDSGPGLKKADLENIFRPFYCADPDRDHNNGGTGLGLAIADRVLRFHHGSIRATNGSPRGLVLEMLLPLAGADNLQ